MGILITQSYNIVHYINKPLHSELTFLTTTDAKQQHPTQLL